MQPAISSAMGMVAVVAALVGTPTSIAHICFVVGSFDRSMT
jgi:hypothetical protein